MVILMVYANPISPHVPRGIELLKDQAMDSLFVDTLVGVPIMEDLLGGLPVDPFVIGLW